MCIYIYIFFSSLSCNSWRDFSTRVYIHIYRYTYVYIFINMFILFGLTLGIYDFSTFTPLTLLKRPLCDKYIYTYIFMYICIYIYIYIHV